MSKIQEIQDKIEALEYAKSLLEGELQPLLEQIRSIESKIKGLLEEKIVPLQKELEELKQNKSKEIAENPFFSDKLTKRTAEFFKGKGYLMVDCVKKPADNEHAISKQLWGCHDIALPLFQQLFQKSEDFDYSLEKLEHDSKNLLLNMCKTMSDKGWLTYEVFKKKDSMKIHQNDAKAHKMFYNGGWAEMVNRYLVLKTLNEFAKSHKLKYKIFTNVKLRKLDSDRTDGHDMELDLVVDLGSQFYIFETKSGNALGIEKTLERTKMFTQSGNRFILCCMDEKANPKQFQPIRLFALPKLEKQLNELLQKDFLDSNQRDNRVATTGQPNCPEKPDSSMEANEKAMPKQERNN